MMASLRTHSDIKAKQSNGFYLKMSTSEFKNLISSVRRNGLGNLVMCLIARLNFHGE